MEKSYIPMLAQGCCVPIHLLLCNLFVNTLGFGFIGVAYAANCSDIIALVTIVTVVRW